MGDRVDKFIVLLSTNILSMAVFELLWIPVAKLTVCNRLYIVNKEASFFFGGGGCFQWHNLCLFLHKLKIPLSVDTDVSKHHLDSL